MKQVVLLKVKRGGKHSLNKEVTPSCHKKGGRR